MFDLVGESAKKESEKWENVDYSCFVFEFNWCLKKEIFGLLYYNVFLFGDYKGSWECLVMVDDFVASR